MDVPFTIRRAAETDANSVFEIVKEFQGACRLVDPGVISTSRILAALRNAQSTVHFFIAFCAKNQIAGFILWYEGFSVYRGGSVYNVDAVYVRPSFRQIGLTQQLLGVVAAEAVDNAIAGVSWLAAKSNPEEQQFIQKLGVRPYDNLRYVFVKLSEIERALGGISAR